MIGPPFPPIMSFCVSTSFIDCVLHRVSGYTVPAPVASQHGRNEVQLHTSGVVEYGERMYVMSIQLHCDWVSKVRYWPCMEGVLSCSVDTDRSLVLSDLNGQKDG